MFLLTNFPIKEAQMFSNHFGFLKTVDFEVVTTVATFWQLLEILGLLFYSKIWSQEIPSWRLTRHFHEIILRFFEKTGIAILKISFLDVFVFAKSKLFMPKNDSILNRSLT